MAAPYPNHDLALAPHPEQFDDSDVEAELEVDELDSDTDPEADGVKQSAPKNGNASRPGERIPGHTLLPGLRLENIIQADGVTGNLALSKEGLYVLSIATEEFIKRLIQAAHREASAHRRNQINYTDMAATTQQYQEFMILADTIPVPVTLADAFMLRQEKERELLEDNPALGVPYSNLPSAVPSPDPEPMLSHPKPQKKSRSSTSNGKEREKTNGSSSSRSKHGSKKPSRHDYDTLYPDISAPNGHLQWPDLNGPNDLQGNQRRSSRNGMSSAATSSLPPLLNGHPPSLIHSQAPQYTPEGGYDIDSIHSPPHDPDSRSQTPPFTTGNGPTWPGQFTGPASGFLHAPTAPYGPGGAPQNPGRTIYSQNHRPD